MPLCSTVQRQRLYIEGHPMSLEKLHTGLLILGLVVFYFFVMPTQLDQIENARIVPKTVPSIAIWIIIVAALFQLFSRKISIKLNAVLCLRTLICSLFIIACIALMDRFGFQFGAPILALGVMLGIGERRLHWLFLGGLIIPLGVWVLVEQVLNRILP